MTKLSYSPPGNSKTPKTKLLQLFDQFLRRVKRLLTAQTLPRVARKACQLYLDTDDATLQARCRKVLQTRLQLNPGQVHQFFHTALGESLLDWFRHFFQWPEQRDPQAALKNLLVQMAADPEGLSLLTALRHCPDALEFDLDHLLFTAKRVEWLLAATRATTATIQELSLAEAENVDVAALKALPDLRSPGELAVQRSRLTLPPHSLRHLTEAASRPLEVLCYEPTPWPEQPVPVIVQSHGLASSPEDIELYAQHLASYGYFVAVPQHTGSDVQQVRQMLAGDTTEVFKLAEFINRPLDISHLLDELERDNGRSWSGKLNLHQVGIIGHSFGAYTAFALAGATIHFERLENACGLPTREPNLSLLLQCQALALPRQLYHLKDDRIQAVLTSDSVGSEVFGTAGLAQVKVPVMLLAGSHDLAAPLVLEQLRIFQGLTAEAQYFALNVGKTHVRDMQRLLKSLSLEINWSTPPATINRLRKSVENSLQALSVAFFDQYLRPDQAHPLYLTADYAQFLSQPPYDLWLISQQSKAALDQQLQTLDEQRLAEFSSALETPSTHSPQAAAPQQ